MLRRGGCHTLRLFGNRLSPQSRSAIKKQIKPHRNFGSYYDIEDRIYMGNKAVSACIEMGFKVGLGGGALVGLIEAGKSSNAKTPIIIDNTLAGCAVGTVGGCLLSVPTGLMFAFPEVAIPLTLFTIYKGSKQAAKKDEVNNHQEKSSPSPR